MPTQTALPRGLVTACVNPATLDLPDAPAGPRLLSRSFFPLSPTFREGLRGADGVKTPFLMLRHFYAAECTEGSSGFRYLAVTGRPPEGDARESPVDWSGAFVSGLTGLHMLDFQLAQGDLIELVRRRATAAQ